LFVQHSEHKTTVK